MIRYQQLVFPLCTEIQLGVIAQFGFQPDGEGVIQVTDRSWLTIISTATVAFAPCMYYAQSLEQHFQPLSIVSIDI